MFNLIDMAGYDPTSDGLNEKLAESGFQAYPSHSNKYYNDKGQIVWTDGDFILDKDCAFSKDCDNGWQRYDANIDY